MAVALRTVVIGLAVFGLATLADAQSQGPNAPSTVVNDASFGTVPWALPANAAVSDNQYAGNTPLGMPSQYLSASGFGFSVPVGAVIDGIVVSVERRSAVNTVFDARARIVKGGVVGTADRSLPGTWPTVDTVVNYGSSSDLWGETWGASDINTATFGFALSASDGVDAAAVDAITATVFYSLCGDNQIGLSEDCDDGNTTNGDCCSSTCQFEGNGSPCAADGNDCNGDETCNGAGDCVSNVGPLTSCLTAGKSVLVYKDSITNTKDKLTWKWIKGQAVTFPDLGVPTGSTAYSLCIYAGTTSAAIAEADIAPSPTLWKILGANKGWKYKDKAGTSDGITKVILKSSATNKSKALVKGKGDSLPELPGPPFTEPLTVQLVNSTNNVCYTSTFTTPKKNVAGLYKAKTP